MNGRVKEERGRAGVSDGRGEAGGGDRAKVTAEGEEGGRRGRRWS